MKLQGERRKAGHSGERSVVTRASKIVGFIDAENEVHSVLGKVAGTRSR
jgi:hypothetical protein